MSEMVNEEYKIRFNFLIKEVYPDLESLKKNKENIGRFIQEYKNKGGKENVFFINLLKSTLEEIN